MSSSSELLLYKLGHKKVSRGDNIQEIWSAKTGKGMHIKPCLCSAGVKELVQIESKKYMQHLVEQGNLNFIVTGKIKETGRIITATKLVALHNPKLTVEVWHHY